MNLCPEWFAHLQDWSMTLVKYESELPLGGAVSKDGVNRVPCGCAGPWATTPTPAHTSSTAVASCPPSARSPPLRAQYRLAAITHSGALLRCQLALKDQHDLDPFHRVGRQHVWLRCSSLPGRVLHDKLCVHIGSPPGLACCPRNAHASERCLGTPQCGMSLSGTQRCGPCCWP